MRFAVEHQAAALADWLRRERFAERPVPKFACASLLVEFPAHNREEREDRLRSWVDGGCYMPVPWRRKAYATAQTDLRRLIGIY